MSRLITTLFILFNTLSINAQTPQYSKGSGTSNSTFLLGYTSYAKHSQSIYTPYDLQFPPAGSINTIYYKYGSSGQTLGQTLINFKVYFHQMPDSAFPNTNEFFIGTVLALSADTLVIPPGTSGDWLPISLSIPYNYNPSQSLVVELRFDSTANNSFGTYGTTNNGRKLISGDAAAITGDLSSTVWQDFGFDALAVGINEANPNNNLLNVWPSPFNAEIFLSCLNSLQQGTVQVTDISGAVIFKNDNVKGKSHSVFIPGIAPGLYFLTITENDWSATRKVIKLF